MDTVRVTLDLAAPPARTPVAGPDAGAGFDARSGSARFVTGDAIRLDIRVARLGSRMLARIIDILVQVVLFFVLMIVLFMVAGALSLSGAVQFDDNLFSGLVVILLVVVLVVYPVVLELATRGRSIGKALLGLRVVRDDGGPIRFRQAMTRGLISAVLEWPGILAPPLTWLASLITMVVSPSGKRLGDYASGTIVIHERAPAAWGWVPSMPNGAASWAATLDLAGLDDNLALAVRHFLARNKQLREPARTQLGHALAMEVAAVTNPPPPPSMPGWAYLAAVHAERHRRALLRLAAVRARAALVWPELTNIALALPAAPPPAPFPGAFPPAAALPQVPGAVRPAVPTYYPPAPR